MANLNIVDQALDAHSKAITSLKSISEDISCLGYELLKRIKSGATIFWMGNGGSAADCQHLAAEIVGRFVKERKGLSSIALTTDTSILTAIGNDYGYEMIFSRQIEALCCAKDVVIGISTSGNSSNIIHAMQHAKDIGAFTVGFTGANGGLLSRICDMTLKVPSSTTARIQECHILIGHILCEYIDADF